MVPIFCYELFWLLIGQMTGIFFYLFLKISVVIFLSIPILLIYLFRKHIYMFYFIGMIIGFTSIWLKIYYIYEKKEMFDYFKGRIAKLYTSADRNYALVKLNDSNNYIKIQLIEKSNKNETEKLNDSNYINSIQKFCYNIYPDLQIKNTDFENIPIGSKISGHVSLYDIPGPCMPEGKDIRYKEFFSRVIFYGKSDSFKIKISNNLSFLNRMISYINKNFKRSGLFKGILLGHSHSIPKDIRAIFQKASTSHLLAISGLHIVLIVMAFYGVIRWGLYFFIHKYYINIEITHISKIFSMLGIIFYLSLIDASASSIRAIIMISIPILSYWSTRKTVPSHGLMLAMFCILFIWPESILYPGFQFSCLTVFGLISFKSRFRNYFMKIIYSTLICYIITIPLTAYWFNQVPSQPFTANLACIPLISLIMFLLTIWLILFKFNIYFDGFNKLIDNLLYLLIKSSQIFGSIFNKFILIHQIHYLSVLFWVISIVLLANLKKNKYWACILMIPFFINVYKKPNDMFLVSKNGEIGIFTNGFLYAENDTFNTNCWANYVGAKLMINADEVKKYAKIKRKDDKFQYVLFFNNNILISKRDLKNCPCKIDYKQHNMMEYWS